ncbi:very-long-chain 3-oxoacyl-CoA synthase [Ranunculus cassubicifolius]
MEHLLLLCLVSLIFSFLWILHRLVDQRHHSCYIIDYACHKPKDYRKITARVCGDVLVQNKNLGADDFRFFLKLMTSSGTGEETYAPGSFIMGRAQSPTLSDGISEMEEAFYQTLDNLFSMSKFSPTEIDLLVVNVSTFSPSPSLSSRIVNRYKMKEDIKVFNLSGMGCSASLISLNLVQNVFKCRKNVFALVCATEAIAPHWYVGTDRSMMLPNVLFRSGGTAILLTNNPNFKATAMFKLKYLVRTHLGANDDAYECVTQKEDDQGYLGVSLSERLPKVAIKAISMNLRELAPKVVPIWELCRYIFFLATKRKATMNSKTGINHFIIHPGGPKVIDGVGKSLGLVEYDLEPSRMTLHRFGNTSSSSIWYVLAYMDAKKRLRKGDNVFMISLGSGFKCNTCILEVVSDFQHKNVWTDCIGSYPKQTPPINPFKKRYGWIHNIVDPSTIKVLMEDKNAMQEYSDKWSSENC